MKVALIEPVGGHGGMNYYDFGLASGLVSQGGDVCWFTCEKTDECSINGIEIIKNFRGVYGASNKVIRFTRFVYALFNSLVRCKIRKIKVVHYHFFGIGVLDFLMCYIAKVMSFKICVTMHDVESFNNGNSMFFARKLFPLVDQFIVHNQVSARELEQAALHSRIEIKCSVIPHGNYCGVVKKLPKEYSKSVLCLPEGVFTILFFGQIKSVKGLDVLLRALRIQCKEREDVHLVIAGKLWKEDFSSYQKIIDDGNLGDRLTLHMHYIADSDVDIYYSAADCVVLPYRKIYQSGVLLMAMSYGVPVIVSDLDGMLEVVTHQKTGLVFDEGNECDLAEKINELMSNVVLKRDVASGGLKLMQEKYDWKEIGAKTMEVYGAMI
ncbi:MAG: glycosyltransferase family 4 protein [Cycloclasticus sp.]|nr:glycosyltransferase family 4 protein [Cycloclasticus sp.]